MNYRNACPKCGGDIEGDGCTTAFHCENAEDWLYIEPDAQPVLCASYSYDDDADDDSVVKFTTFSDYLTDCMQPFGQLQYLSPEGIPIKEDLNILWIKGGFVEVEEMPWLKERVNYLGPLQPYSPYTRWWAVSEYEKWLYSMGCDQIIIIDFEKEYSQDVWYDILRTYQSTTYTGGDGDDYED